jgi:hypothetical protein
MHERPHLGPPEEVLENHEMSKLDLSQISLSDLIVSIQYQVGKQLSEARQVVKVLRDSFPDKAHVSKVVKEFEERIDWLTGLKESLEESVEGASPRFIKEFKERHALLIAAFQETEYITPAKPFKKTPPKKTPPASRRTDNKRQCPHCLEYKDPRGWATHVRTCPKNPKNKREEKKPERKSRRKDPTKPCRHCTKPIRKQNHKRHENACPENPKNLKPAGEKKTATKKSGRKKGEGRASIEARLKEARKNKAVGTLSPHNQEQTSEWDKKHKAGVKKKKVKNARYLCENCGHVEVLPYKGKDTVECPKCQANTFNAIAKLDVNGDRVEDFQVEEEEVA